MSAPRLAMACHLAPEAVPLGAAALALCGSALVFYGYFFA